MIKFGLKIRLILVANIFILAFLIISISYSALQKNLPRIGEINYGDEHRKCLALNVYFEARNQPIRGQMAVAYVTLNRVNDMRFPKTICEVVKQGKYYGNSPRRDKCQFSFWCDGRSDKPKNITAWNNARKIADRVLNNYGKPKKDMTRGALYYHANYVKPDWSKFNLEHSVTIGSHIFYKVKGERN